MYRQVGWSTLISLLTRVVDFLVYSPCLQITSLYKEIKYDPFVIFGWNIQKRHPGLLRSGLLYRKNMNCMQVAEVDMALSFSMLLTWSLHRTIAALEWCVVYKWQILSKGNIIGCWGKCHSKNCTNHMDQRLCGWLGTLRAFHTRQLPMGAGHWPNWPNCVDRSIGCIVDSLGVTACD